MLSSYINMATFEGLIDASIKKKVEALYKKVGKDDEFHGGRMNFRGADEPQPPNPTGSSRLFPALQFV